MEKFNNEIPHIVTINDIERLLREGNTVEARRQAGMLYETLRTIPKEIGLAIEHSTGEVPLEAWQLEQKEYLAIVQRLEEILAQSK